MALRLDTAVIRGEIDNTSRGNIRGRLWLVGREEPVSLDLRGDAWRDIAGCKVIFTNPDAGAQPAADVLMIKQTGYVGDITTSGMIKKSDVLEEQEDEESPAAGRTALYFEWFSEANGRVVVESENYELSISEWVWEMDAAAEEAQKMTNLHAMRGWLAGIIQRPEHACDEDEYAEEDFDDSEDSWEDSLKQSDRLSDAHMEALEKYGFENIRDDRVAFVMGWDHLLGGGAGLSDTADEDDDSGEEWKQTDQNAADGEDGDEFGGSFDEDEHGEHPLQARSHDLVMRLLDEIEDDRSENARDPGMNTPLDRFIRNSMNISGKLAGALGMGGSQSAGYVLAILRRCLNWANEALAALNELKEAPEWQNRLHLLQDYQAELFALRDGITDLRKELREK